MSSHRKDKKVDEVRVELKYCEHCGSLWVRERGAGVVYCEKCQRMVEDLPSKKKRPGRIKLPSGPQPAVNEYKMEIFDDDLTDIEAVGGVAWAR